MNYCKENESNKPLEEAMILLIEDDPDHAELIIDVLKKENIKKEIVLLKDGVETRDYFHKFDLEGNYEICSQIDLIILDLNLPKLSGIDVLKFIKNNANFSSIPIIILSTSSDQETIDEAFKIGASDYIIKPDSYDAFVEKIKILKEYC
ncbi:MAG: response regulator [Candidatus Scalindua sp.]